MRWRCAIAMQRSCCKDGSFFEHVLLHIALQMRGAEKLACVKWSMDRGFGQHGFVVCGRLVLEDVGVIICS